MSLVQTLETSIIDKLRKNLNLLKDEFNAQVERTKTESEKSKYKKRGKEQAEFINLFGSINAEGTQEIS